jgi:hypothetical protein
MKVVHDTDPDSLVVDGDPANQVFGSDGYNSARTYSVVQFLEWAEQNFPAQHTMLVLDDHGTGWLPGRRTGSQVQPPRDPSAILLDSDDGPGMADTGELAAAIAPYHFDVLYLQACNMGQVEVAYDFRNAADWIVTSEAVLWEPGCAFSGVVSAWQAAFPLCARDVARLIPDQTYLRYGSDQPLSMAVIKAAGIEPLVAAFDKLAAWIAIGPAADRAYFYAGYRLLDIIPESSGERDLDAAIDNFLYYQPSAINRQAAQDVLGLLNTTIDRTRFVKYVGMAGLSIYLPDSPAKSSGQIGLYQQTAFGADTHWVQMLESL